MVVHGRFIAFDLARALLRRGHDVTLFTNYPRWAVERFGFPGSKVKSFWQHGVLTRAAHKLHRANILGYRDEWFNPMFSRWASAELDKEHWDVVNCWSGASEEILRGVGTKALKLLIRGSAHVQTQARLLEEEEERTGVRQELPSDWTIAREKREYDLADGVVTLSTFAQTTFIREGVDLAKVEVLPLGASTDDFCPSADVIETRCRRIRSHEPLRVLFVGALSYQKGFHDMATTLRLVAPDIAAGLMSFKFVGPVAPEVKKSLVEFASLAEFVPKKPQHELAAYYGWGDIFWFPTIQDGYAAVLAQANAGALPIITTTNGGGRDLITYEDGGWVLPIRNPQLFAERLRWCEHHREELAAMVQRIYNNHPRRDWNDVAADFEAICWRRATPLLENRV